MTQPRIRIPGATVHLTRTTSERRFLLLPLGPVNDTFLYCFFAAAKKYGILVHCLFVHRNHYHAVVTDPHGLLSDFTHDAHWYISRSLLPHYRQMRPDVHLQSLWSNDKPGETLLPTANAVLRALDYALTNATKDGLVYSHDRWTGICLGPKQWGQRGRVVKRPDDFFLDDGALPDEVECTVVAPAHFFDRTPEPLAEEVAERVGNQERAIRATLRAEGKTFRGMERVLRDSPFDAPKTPRRKSRVKPAVAAGGDRKLFDEAVQHVHAFRKRYRECINRVRELLRRGADPRGVIFPYGTLLMRTRHGFRCEAPQLSWCVLLRVPS